MIRLKDVQMEYENGTKAIKGITLTIEDGEFVFLVGPSGSGKSTLLNIIGGIDQADSGDICIRGERMADMKEKKLTLYRRKHLGYIFQMYNLIPNLTALENVELALQICKNPMDAQEVMEDVGLGERLDNFPAQLSGGEQQRVAIARAVVNEPAILLADEPTGNLDSASSKEILQILKSMHEQGKTVILITHDNGIAAQARRVVRIMDGKIESDFINKNYGKEEYIKNQLDA